MVNVQALVGLPEGQANRTLNERADPKVQLEQAISEAQDQHRRLKEQAANVIANQKQTEMRLNRSARRAREGERQRPPGAVMAADADRRGDAAKAAEYTDAPRRSPTADPAREGRRAT